MFDEDESTSIQSRFMEYDNPTPHTDARYLMMLSETILRIPLIYGVDQGDHGFLRSIASRLSEKAVGEHLDEYTE